MEQVNLPFPQSNFTDPPASNSSLTLDDLPQPLQAMARAHPFLFDYVRALPLDEIGIPTYVATLSRAMSKLKQINLIYPTNDNDLFIHIYPNPRDARDIYIPIEPPLIVPLNELVQKVEDRLLEMAETIGKAEEADRKQALIDAIDQICVLDSGTAEQLDGKEKAPARSRFKTGKHTSTKLPATARELEALKYRTVRDKLGLGVLQPLLEDPYIEDISCSGLGSYMSAVAGAGIARSRVFELGANLPRVPADYFKRVHLLAQKLGYDYAGACTKVGLAVKSDTMVSLLLRLGNALVSGQPEADFLTEEAGVQAEAYEKEYERDLESLTKWTDAYAAVTVSATLMIVINMTSSLIYDLGNGVIVGLVITSLAVSSVTAWILSRAAPKEVIDLFSPDGTWPQRLAGQLAIYTLAAVFIICPLLLVVGMELGPTLLIAALILLPLGAVSMWAGREIDQKDREFGPFLRSLGGMAVSTGTTITEALTRLDLSSFPTLEVDLIRLRSRLLTAVDPQLCWHKFALETGSKLIGETVTIFNDAVRLGADPDTVAFLAAEFGTRTIMLRAKRKVVASTFSWLTVAMHGTVSGLMVIILEIIRNFTLMITEAAGSLDAGSLDTAATTLPTFNTPAVGFFEIITIAMVILLSVVNAYAINATDGGHKYKAVFFLALLLILSGVSFIVIPPLVEGIVLSA